MGERGTAVRLRLRNPLSLLLESGFLEETLLRHFQPLFEPEFAPLLAAHYPGGVGFLVNGRALAAGPVRGERAALSIRLARKRKPSALGYVARFPGSLPENDQGLAVSTLGKMIKRGWDWLGFAPQDAPRIGGLIEVPGLAESLTLNKADFIRSGPRGALYLAYRKALQEAVSSQLAAWGDSRNALEEEARRRRARPVERDLAAILVEMAEDFPLIASLVEQRKGGQKRLPMGPVTGDGPALGLGAGPGAAVEPAAPESQREPQAPPAGEGSTSPEPAPSSETPPAEKRDGAELSVPGGRGKRRPARLGLTIQFETRPDDPGLGRLVQSTVWVNEAHPAYRRAVATRAEGYHLALTVAMALAPLAVEAAEGQAFVTAFLARWGEAIERPQVRRQRR